ncbi:MAG: ribose 5-phosphate isomerase B [archaeon]|nr:ribose 5-phosphate isomerase B [archaeon]
MKFYIGSDHAGYDTKEKLQRYLQRKGIETVDLGAHSKERVDYPDFAQKVAKKVAKDKGSFGLLVCGTGIGMSMAANKVKGIRAANPFDSYTAKKAREHNDANIICLGGRSYDARRASSILGAFISAKPGKEKRHKARVAKIMKLEKKQ